MTHFQITDHYSSSTTHQSWALDGKSLRGGYCYDHVNSSWTHQNFFHYSLLQYSLHPFFTSSSAFLSQPSTTRYTKYAASSRPSSRTRMTPTSARGPTMTMRWRRYVDIGHQQRLRMRYWRTRQDWIAGGEAGIPIGGVAECAVRWWHELVITMMVSRRGAEQRGRLVLIVPT